MRSVRMRKRRVRTEKFVWFEELNRCALRRLSRTWHKTKQTSSVYCAHLVDCFKMIGSTLYTFAEFVAKPVYTLIGILDTLRSELDMTRQKAAQALIENQTIARIAEEDYAVQNVLHKRALFDLRNSEECAFTILDHSGELVFRTGDPVNVYGGNRSIFVGYVHTWSVRDNEMDCLTEHRLFCVNSAHSLYKMGMIR